MNIWDQIKRYAITLLGVGLIALNRKLGWNFSDTDLAALAAMIVGYVGTSTWKATKLAEAATAADNARQLITDFDKATAVVKGTVG